MTNYSNPLRARVLRLLRLSFNTALGTIRTPIRRPVVLLVTGQASQAKALEVESRLRFLLAHIDKPLQIRAVHRASPLAYIRNTAVAGADSSAIPAFAARYLRWVADLDYDTNLADGWSLMELGAAINHRSERKLLAAAHTIFNDHVRKLKIDGPRPAYIFGTGPSLHLAGERSFSDGFVVVCNTIVRDPELWHHLAPSFLTAGDAIYHFGHTAHARAFRADTLKRLQESNGRTLFVYPAMFDVIVRSEFRDVESLLVPVPYTGHTSISVDLTQCFGLPEVENVLAILLLPLGCTLSRDVRLWGFDGRAPNDSGFWANSDRHAYPELMQSIRDSHPAFFANKTPVGNEVQYVEQVHGNLLDERLAEAERRGFTFRMLHHSWTPTLQKRYSEFESLPDQE
jgi:hypothetical protein